MGLPHGRRVDSMDLGRIAQNLGEEREHHLSGMLGDFNFDVGQGVDGIEALKPSMLDFNDVYTPERIKKDQGTLKGAEEKFDSGYAREVAKAAEYMVIEAIYSGNWLDRENYDIYVNPTSKFDDTINGIDVVISIKDQNTGEWMYLGIDVTTSQDEEKLRLKLYKTAAILKRNQLSKIDYYHPNKPSEEEKGTIQMPRVVVGIDPESLADLINVYQNKKEEKSLENDESQIEFRQEIIDQLVISIENILNNNPKSTVMARRTYQDTPIVELNTIQEALAVNIDHLNSPQQRMVETIKQMLEFVNGVRQEKNPEGRSVNPSRVNGSKMVRELAPRLTPIEAK